MSEPAKMIQFPDLEEKRTNDYSDADQHGPLPCGCYRMEVYDFGHDSRRCTDPAAEKGW